MKDGVIQGAWQIRVIELKSPDGVASKGLHVSVDTSARLADVMEVIIPLTVVPDFSETAHEALSRTWREAPHSPEGRAAERELTSRHYTRRK